MAYVTSIPNITRSVFHSLPKNPKQQNGARCFIAQLHDSLHLSQSEKMLQKAPALTAPNSMQTSPPDKSCENTNKLRA